MLSIERFLCNENIVQQVESWTYGKNWPVVYVYYNNDFAYVGESLDGARRAEQHLHEKEFDAFTDVCFISDRTFNKSVVLDLESYLIKYMGADGSKKLINGNAGIVDHDYFYKEIYEDDFVRIWNELLERGIVSKTILEIENSELFKYSPYKTLNVEQQRATYEIMKMLSEIDSTASQNNMIMVNGGAGTGKTILAVYLVKLLSDIGRDTVNWDAVEEYGDSLRRMQEKLIGIKHIGFVVPMAKLRNTMKTVFKSINGLSEKMVLAPEEVVNSYYDLLIVDEAHRLYQRKHLPGMQVYNNFDDVNIKLMGSACKKDESDLTELDWIISQSRSQVLFYDKLQRIRTPDIPPERFMSICKQKLYKELELVSQMRCRGGNGYYEYVKDVLENVDVGLNNYRKISGYVLETVDSIDELFSKINAFKNADNLCAAVTGPGWAIKEDIVIEEKVYHWEKDICSIHQIQGFDLNYTGVIFGKEVYYDTEMHCIRVKKDELRDNFTKSSGDDDMRNYLLNIYLTLMTRGINGTIVYAVDQNLSNYFKHFFN